MRLYVVLTISDLLTELAERAEADVRCAESLLKYFGDKDDKDDYRVQELREKTEHLEKVRAARKELRRCEPCVQADGTADIEADVQTIVTVLDMLRDLGERTDSDIRFKTECKERHETEHPEEQTVTEELEDELSSLNETRRLVTAVTRSLLSMRAV